MFLLPESIPTSYGSDTTGEINIKLVDELYHIKTKFQIYDREDFKICKRRVNEFYLYITQLTQTKQDVFYEEHMRTYKGNSKFSITIDYSEELYVYDLVAMLLNRSDAAHKCKVSRGVLASGHYANVKLPI